MTVLDQPRLDQPLSTAMREGSRAEHEAAEGSSFMSELLAGRVNEAGYTAYLLRLRQVYDALETTARGHLDDPAVAAVHDPAVERLAAVDADLQHWAPGIDPSTHAVDSPAAAAYHQRILDSAAWGGLFAAHHYTRYLGDLSGGQAIGRILDREFELDGHGVAFYAFADVPKIKLFKDAYRARLDALDLSPEDRRRVVEEVKVAFGHNGALFVELSGSLAQFRRVP